jgi:hypothetical protein
MKKLKDEPQQNLARLVAGFFVPVAATPDTVAAPAPNSRKV